jgi:hypothetical protein
VSTVFTDEYDPTSSPNNASKVLVTPLHPNAATEVKTVTKDPAKSSSTLYLETEEWVSG